MRNCTDFVELGEIELFDAFGTLLDVSPTPPGKWLFHLFSCGFCVLCAKDTLERHLRRFLKSLKLFFTTATTYILLSSQLEKCNRQQVLFLFSLLSFFLLLLLFTPTYFFLCCFHGFSFFFFLAGCLICFSKTKGKETIVFYFMFSAQARFCLAGQTFVFFCFSSKQTFFRFSNFVIFLTPKETKTFFFFFPPGMKCFF